MEVYVVTLISAAVPLTGLQCGQTDVTHMSGLDDSQTGDPKSSDLMTIFIYSTSTTRSKLSWKNPNPDLQLYYKNSAFKQSLDHKEH